MSAVTERDGHDDDNESIGVLKAPEAFSGSADEFVREYLTMTCRREVSLQGDFRWGPRCDADCLAIELGTTPKGTQKREVMAGGKNLTST
jgi:hypothetical protein